MITTHVSIMRLPHNHIQPPSQPAMWSNMPSPDRGDPMGNDVISLAPVRPRSDTVTHPVSYYSLSLLDTQGVLDLPSTVCT